jgi:hypothetical protein
MEPSFENNEDKIRELKKRGVKSPLRYRIRVETPNSQYYTIFSMLAKLFTFARK